MGLFERLHLPDQTPLAYTVARVAVFTATAYWYLLPSIPEDRSEGRLHLRSRCSLKESAIPSLLNFISTYGGWATALYFQNAHSNFCPRSRTPPFPQIDSPMQISKTKATIKGLSRGRSKQKFKASIAGPLL